MDLVLTLRTDTFLFLFFSMIIVAMTLYLPQHIVFITKRAWFYYHGEDSLNNVAKTVPYSANIAGIRSEL